MNDDDVQHAELEHDLVQQVLLRCGQVIYAGALHCTVSNNGLGFISMAPSSRSLKACRWTSVIGIGQAS